MKLVKLKVGTKKCERCKAIIKAGEKAWRVVGRRGSRGTTSTKWYCRKCGDKIQY